MATVSVSDLLAQGYSWIGQPDNSQRIVSRIEPPSGFDRIEADSLSFAGWLRNLPLKAAGSPVLLHNGQRKRNQDAHVAVVDIDVGTRDLQQCADAVIRLRSEHFFSRGQFDSISFDFTSGDAAPFREWISGVRPKVRGNKVEWIESSPVDSSYQSFRDYLDVVFTYAGSYSLERQMKRKEDICDVSIGDIFIQGGFPGHTVIVVDVATNMSTGDRIFMVAQSFMPAQQIHVLKNPHNSRLSPWYECDFGAKLRTPEWTFKRGDLREF
jgi:hypothetical protein